MSLNHAKEAGKTKPSLFKGGGATPKPTTPEVLAGLRKSFPGMKATVPGRHKGIAHTPPVVRIITGK